MERDAYLGIPVCVCLYMCVCVWGGGLGVYASGGYVDPCVCVWVCVSYLHMCIHQAYMYIKENGCSARELYFTGVSTLQGI